MPDPQTLTLFALASLALLLVPGPAVLYIVARSLQQGRAAGFASVLGVGTGSLLHFAAAALGLSALLAASAVGFAIVKWLGAAYLVWLGLRTLLGRTEAHAPEIAGQPRSLRRVYVQGVIVNVLNPKMALFALAFLPPFLDPARGPVMTQALLLGVLFVTLALLSDGLYALTAGSLGAWLRRRPGALRVQKWVSGSIYLALGAATAAGVRNGD